MLPQGQKVQRQPLPRSEVVIKSPTQYAQRGLRIDPKTGEEINYDPKPRVVPVDAKAGKLAFKWIGYDGKEKVIEYQRADAIDAIVSASATRTPSGQYIYIYKIRNLPSSATYLSHFVVQNFSANVKPIELDNVSIGQMSNLIQQFSEGNWTMFGILSKFKPQVVPGQEIELRVISTAPPGLVGCRITAGNSTLKGVGEDMPQELEDMLPGYKEWPKGYTIGPVDNLKSLSSTEWAKRLLDLLPKFRELGWMTDESLRWYQRNLKRNDFGEAYKRAEQDLKTEQITTEVFAMIRSIKQQQ